MNADALLRLGEATAAAAVGVLEKLAPGGVERGSVDVAAADADPFAGAPVPSVVAAVSYVDGVTGGNLFVVSLPAARRLAAAMHGEAGDGTADAGAADAVAADDGAADDGEQLTELELSAVSEAANQMLAVAETRLVSEASEAEGLYVRTPHAAHVSLTIFGEPARLIQLIPNAFVVKLDRAFDEQYGEILERTSQPSAPIVFDPERLRGVSLRVWAELGRAEPPVGRTVGLGPGSVLELDRNVDEPVDLYVNGRRFAAGRLMVAEDGDWAVQIDTIEPGLSLEPEPELSDADTDGGS
jgi:flagellar motor switch protein FliN/FliY